MVEVDLGGQNNLVAGDVFKRPAQVFFAGPVGVDVGGVKEVNSGVEGVVDDAIARLFIQGLGVGGAVAKAHAAQAEFRDLNVGVANCCVFHGYSPINLMIIIPLSFAGWSGIMKGNERSEGIEYLAVDGHLFSGEPRLFCLTAVFVEEVFGPLGGGRLLERGGLTLGGQFLSRQGFSPVFTGVVARGTGGLADLHGPSRRG